MTSRHRGIELTGPGSNADHELCGDPNNQLQHTNSKRKRLNEASRSRSLLPLQPIACPSGLLYCPALRSENSIQDVFFHTSPFFTYCRLYTCVSLPCQFRGGYFSRYPDWPRNRLSMLNSCISFLSAAFSTLVLTSKRSTDLGPASQPLAAPRMASTWLATAPTTQLAWSAVLKRHAAHLPALVSA